LIFTKAGKGFTLAFFFISFYIQAVYAQQTGYPVINRLDSADIGFRQLSGDVEANRMRAARINNRQMLGSSLEIAELLTIYQYTVRPGEDLLFLAARCNVPYSAIASLNRISNSTSLQAGRTVLIPSYPGIFIPFNPSSDLEMILGAARESAQGAVELIIRVAGVPQPFLFFPGTEFSPTERAFFLNSAQFRFPLRDYRLTSSYGMRNDPFTGVPAMHSGIDLGAPEGTEVFAAADGTVTAVGFDPVYGNYIIISHSNNWTSLYGHLSAIETVLRTEVKSGNLIGRVGSTGYSTGPHLHFELRQDGRAFDPAGRLRP